MCLFKNELKYRTSCGEDYFFISLIKNGHSLGGLRSSLHPDKKEIFINDICVRDKLKYGDNYLKYINKGYGSHMMSELISYAKQNGYQRIIGELSPVDENNDIDTCHRDRQLYFYKKFGFNILPNESCPKIIELNLF